MDHDAPLESQPSFRDQESRAFALGQRMASAGFAHDDNPFAALNLRLASRWSRGFLGVNTLKNIVAARSRPALVARDGRAVAS